MNCVWYAYCDHLKWLGWVPSWSVRPEFACWVIMKQIVNGDPLAPTKGSVAPWLVKQLARLHGLEITVQTKVYTKRDHLEFAESAIERWVVRNSDYGRKVRRITLEPAIYMNSRTRHAYFGTCVRYNMSPWVDSAIQLRRR